MSRKVEKNYVILLSMATITVQTVQKWPVQHSPDGGIDS